jgi:hypothetical protein
MLGLVGVQEVRCEGSGRKLAGECMFFYGKGDENNKLGKGFLYKKESCQQLRRLILFVMGCHI